MSPLAFFRQSKAVTLAWAAFCAVLAIVLMNLNLGPCAVTALIYAGFMASIAAYKFRRDWRIVHAAEINAAKAPAQLLEPSMTSPGSSRLFVPPPLNER